MEKGSFCLETLPHPDPCARWGSFTTPAAMFFFLSYSLPQMFAKTHAKELKEKVKEPKFVLIE